MIKPNDLNREQREAYDTWRAIGLTESAALAALVDAGLIRLSEEDKLARRFQDIFGLSESAAQRAVDGRDGPSRRASGTPVSDAEAANLRPDPALIGHVIRKIEEVASDLCRRGVPEEKALKESAFEMMRAMPTEQLADWVVRIAAFRWPWMYASSGSSGGGKNTQTRPVGGTPRQRSREVRESAGPLEKIPVKGVARLAPSEAGS